MRIHTVGIDIAKTVFHLVDVDEKGSVVVKKKFSRPQLLVYTANLKAEVIGMEACSGAHFLTRALMIQGHNVKLMPAEYVRPYVKSNKNDFIECRGNCGGSPPTQHALRLPQDRGAARSAGASSCP